MDNKTNERNVTMRTVTLVIISLLASLLLWTYVTSTEKDDYTRQFNYIPVTFDGETTMREARSLVLTERGVNSVRISITGDRRTVSRLNEDDLKAVIDLNNISAVGRYTSTYKISFPSGVDSSALTVSSKSPESITFQVDRLTSTYVDVKGTFSGSVAEGYSMEPMEFNPSTVKISGPLNAIEKVADAYVEISREDVDKTVSFDVGFALRDIEGNVIEDDSITTEVDAVSVTLPVIAVKEVALNVKLIEGGGATVDNTKITFSPSNTVTLAGDSEALEGVNRLDVATIDLSEVQGTYTETVTFQVPNNTEIIVGSREVTVTVQLIGLETKNVSVTNFSCVNVTEGYEAEVLTDRLNVVLRGTPEALAEVSDLNVRAEADLSAVQAFTGYGNVPVRIRVDGVPNVGSIGSYEVIVNHHVKTN